MTRAETRAVDRAMRWRTEWERHAWWTWARQIEAECLDRCPAVHARQRCGTPITSRRVAGVVVPVCARCERKRAGRCVDCGALREDPAPQVTFCAACARRRKLDSRARSDRKGAAARAAKALAAYHALSPEERRARNAIGALYRVAAPHLVRAHVTKERHRRQTDPTVRERARQNSRRSHERQRLGTAKRERYTPAGERLCRTPTCTAVMRHTKERYCPTCKAARIAAARQQLRAGATRFPTPEAAA